MELLLTRTVFKRLKEDFASKLEAPLNSKNTTVRIIRLKLAASDHCCYEKFMYLCLFDKQGKYDHRVVMSFDLSALRWGRELLVHYKNLSRGMPEI